MKTIQAHEVIVHGVDHEQFFQGCGVAFTEFTEVATGIGSDAHEAFDDALENLAEGDWDVEAVDTADGWTDAPKPGDLAMGEDAHEALHVYVSVRVR